MKMLSPKTKTSLRSLLAGMSLFFAGAKMSAQASPNDDKAPTPIVKRVVSNADKLAISYSPLCEELESNLPFCYLDKGIPTIGCGVHFGDFSQLKNLKAIKITLKSGKSISLKKEKYGELKKMAAANWQDPKTYSLFPYIEKAENTTLEKCTGSMPTPKMKSWNGCIFIIPYSTLEKANSAAIYSKIESAQKCHPNLFQLPPTAQMVVLDLIYNLGYQKYKENFPNFQNAVKQNNLENMKKECSSKNARRYEARCILMDSAIFCQKYCSKKSENEIKKIHQNTYTNSKLSPKLEKKLWHLVNLYTPKNHSWAMNKMKGNIQSSVKEH